MISEVVVCLFGNALFIAVFVCSNNVSVCVSSVMLILSLFFVIVFVFFPLCCLFRVHYDVL